MACTLFNMLEVYLTMFLFVFVKIRTSWDVGMLRHMITVAFSNDNFLKNFAFDKSCDHELVR